MCGIAGLFNMSGKPVRVEDLHRFNISLSHRGPDGNGIWHSGSVGFAHTRLSIIDLTENGKQPMCNEDRSVWITFNGEIYNYLELRKPLMKAGYRFRSDTDTEVLLHLYEEKGVNCLDHLRGMFAFAIWDSSKNQLFIAKDRIGKKPLFYTVQDNIFVFASELKAIKALPWIRCDFDPSVLSYVFSYDHVPWPNTMYSNIRKLPPASYLLFSDQSDLEPRSYWHLNLQEKVCLSESEAVRQLRQVMSESVKLRLRSDVPLGMFLSGGVDSSFIVGMASQLLGKPIKTFSIGFRDQRKQDPEYHFSREVSERFQTEHTELVFDKNVIGEMPGIIHNYDEPFCIPNALAHHQLCRETRKSVMVALAGDGADEIFAGYDVYKQLNRIDRLSFFNPWRNSRRLPARPKGVSSRILLGLCLLAIPRPFRRGFLKQATFESRFKELFSKNLSQKIGDIYVGELLDRFYLDANPRQFLDGVLYVDLLINYAWSTTIATDISGMANSLEVRSPFLDHKVVEFAFSLPDRLKLGPDNQEKKILYSAAKGLLPVSVIERKKMSYGAGIPYIEFFFHEWLPYVKDVIFDDKIKSMDLFDLSQVANLLNRKEHSHDQFKALWKLFCCCVWLHANK